MELELAQLGDGEGKKLLVIPHGTHQVLAYADDVNLIGDDIRTIERNADVLLNACKVRGSAVNLRKTKYIEIDYRF